MAHPLDETYREAALVRKGEKITLLTYEHGADRVRISGYDVGPSLSIARRTETEIVVRCGGHSTFAGRGERAYVPTQYWKMTISRTEGTRLSVEVKDTLIAGRDRKAVRAFVGA